MGQYHEQGNIMEGWGGKFFLVLLIMITQVDTCYAAEMGMITGREKGTYYQFGLNLRELEETHGIKLIVYSSAGSIENIYAVFKRRGVAIGIVQSDVLAFVARVESSPVLKTVSKKIKMVFPLYNEEVHILARRGVADLNALSNKTVAIGEDGSGTYLTAKLLLEVSNVKPREVVLVGTDEALKRLKAGTIDAMFYVAGQPVKLLVENVTEADGLDLVPIVNKDIYQFYPKAEIPANTYSWQKNSVTTAAVKAVLVSFDFKTDECELVGRFARILADNLDWLRQNGHPKWKSVDLNYTLKGWEQYDCVRKALAKPKAPGTPPQEPSRPNPVLDAIKELVE